MKIRLTGTQRETAYAAESIRTLLGHLQGPSRYRVREVSGFYANRESDLGRVYLEVDVEMAGDQS